MKTKIIQIGNSRGVRIPQLLLKECQLSGMVELNVEKDGLMIRPIHNPKIREGWNDIFNSLRQADADDPNLQTFCGVTNHFDRKDWQW